MKKFLVIFLCLEVLLVCFSNCGQSGFSVTDDNGVVGTGLKTVGGTTTVTPGNGGGSTVTTVNNTMPITVGCGYTNQPCVTVKICVPGTTKCTTISNVLLDTGSYGLRLFSTSVTKSLGFTQMKAPNGGDLAECVGYLDGSSDWGPIARADVLLGGEVAPNLPIQFIESTYGTPPSGCTNMDKLVSDSDPGFNGILGVGLTKNDCGSCETSTDSSSGVLYPYYSCKSGVCSKTLLSATTTINGVVVANQVSNPVSYFTKLGGATDNNGVIVTLPSIALAGANNVAGTLTFGIGTRGNNLVPTSVTRFKLDAYGQMRTQFQGKSYGSFIDSGSNASFFKSNLAVCSGSSSDFYCVNGTYTAKNLSTDCSSPVTSTFYVSNADTLGNYTAFKSLAGDIQDDSAEDTSKTYTCNGILDDDVDVFDWGLPFFFGKTIYFGIHGATSPLGTGPYFAY